MTHLLLLCGMEGRKPRVVVDLRRVNTALYPDAYPLPKQDSILGALGGATLFSSMDITCGFFQQPVHEEDSGKPPLLPLTRARNVNCVHYGISQFD